MQKNFYKFMRKYLKENNLFWTFFVTAFILRFAFSYFYPITLDEAWSHHISQFPIEAITAELKSDSTSPILIYLIHKLFNFSRNEFLIRFPFWLSGFISLFFIYNTCEKKISSIIIPSLSLFAIKEGSIARMHSLALLFSSASFYFFLKTFQHSSKKDFTMLTFFSILTAYNFYPAVSFTFSLFFSSLIFRKESASPFRFYLISFLVFLFLSMPAFYFLDTSSVKNRFITDLTIPTGAFLPYIFHSFAFSDELFSYKKLNGLNIVFFALITLPVLIVFLKGVICEFNYYTKIVLFSFIFSLLIFFIVSLKIPKILYSPKYLMCLYPAFVYILSRGLSVIKRAKSALFLVFLSIFNLVALYNSLNNNREDWRKACKLVLSILEPNEKIFIFSEQMKYPFSFYYKDTFVALPNKIETEKIWIENPSSILYIKAHDYNGKSIFYQNEIEKRLKLIWYFKNGEIEFFKYKAR